MARIFISYSKKHTQVTERVATHLEGAGHDVWWDVNLLAGHAFRDAIKEQLVASDFVVVIWTQASVQSPWVIAEAEHGFERGVLLPLIHPDVDPADVPMPFGSLHMVSTADLDGLLKRLRSYTGLTAPAKKPKRTSLMGAFFNPSERKFPSQPQAWDLSALYKDSSELEPDRRRLVDLCDAFSANYRGRLAKLTGQEMLACLTEYGKIDETAGRIMSYVGLRRYSDTRDEDAARLFETSQAQVSQATEPLMFFALEMAEMSEHRFAEQTADEPGLEKYRAKVAQMRSLSSYQLSEQEELARHRASERQRLLVQEFDNCMSNLQVDLHYASFGDEQLALEDALSRFTNRESEVRSAALQGLSKALSKQGNALFEISQSLIRAKASEDAARGLSRPDAGRFLSDQVQPGWIDTLVSTIATGHSRTTHRYYALKANWLGEERLRYEDRNAPLPFSEPPAFTYAEAVKMVYETFDGVSPKLGQLVHRFFTHQWVDARNQQGRAPGSFSHPTVPAAHPFVHTWFDGTTRDVATMGRMMGHGVLQALSQMNGPLLDRQPLSLSNAIASFFETLVTEQMMRRTPEEKRPLLTAGFLEDRLNTIERQAMFYRFECKMHALLMSEPDAKVADVNQLWIDEQRAVLGPASDVADVVGWTWSYIPHFVHSPFYTVTYAFGGLLSSVMYAAFLEEREASLSLFTGRLIRAMEAGGTVDFSGTLEILEIDPSDRETWQSGIDVTSAIIDTLEDINVTNVSS